MTGRGRSVLARALTTLAALALVVAIAAAYVREVAGDSDQFANRATNALGHDSVRSLIAERVTDDLVLRSEANLLAARPLIQSVVATVVGHRAFRQLFRAGVRDVHRAVIRRDRDTVTLTVADAGTLAAAALDRVNPSLAAKLRADNRAQLLNDRIGSASATAVRALHTVRLLAIVLGIVALLSAAGAVLVAADRRVAVVELGVAIALAGVLLIVVWTLGRTVAEGEVSGSTARAAVGAVYGSFLGDLRTIAWIVAGAGAVIAAAAASLLRPLAIDEPLRRAWRWLATDPRPAWQRAARGVALIAAGVGCVVDRGAALTILFTAGGVYLIYTGIAALLSLVNRPRRGAVPAGGVGVGAVLRPALVSSAVAAVAVGAAIAVFFGSGGVSTARPGEAPCDGSPKLCDRPLDAVALPATHNAMSVPLPGWYSSEQEVPIPQQLQDGIRGLLFDTHYATRLKDGKLRTEFNGEFDKILKQDPVSPQLQATAERLRERLGFKGTGRRGLYLCHMFCELGATPLQTVLDQIDDFLVANPGQVIVVVNEDYVAPAEFVAQVEKSGLAKLAFTPPAPGRPWPTLRQMIDAGHRILFLAENRAGGAPWYRPAYDSITEETPYDFKHVSQLTDPSKLAASCEPNRGPDQGAPLFLVNGWISTDPVPLPANAAKVNAYRPLIARLRACERVRHHIPNLVAVNFFQTGDLFKAVDALNGVEP